MRYLTLMMVAAVLSDVYLWGHEVGYQQGYQACESQL